MSENTDNTDEMSERPPVGNLTDFVYGTSPTNPLDIEIAVNSTGKVVMFHDKPFKNELSWFEYDLDANKLDFVIDNGDIRDIGLPLAPAIAKHMQNSHQIMAVLLDDQSGEEKEHHFVPLIIHRA